MDYISENNGYHVWNLGSGKGYSVFEIINKFEKLTNRSLKLKILSRREGDLSKYWADISKAKDELNWSPQKGISNMVLDTLLYLKNINQTDD